MAFDAYLKIDSIPGECTDEEHKNWIQLLDFSHSVMQPHGSSVAGGGSRGGVERCEHGDFNVSKYMDISSSLLNLHCCNGKNLKKVTLELCKQVDSKLPYMIYEFETCLIRSVGISGGGGGMPMESVSFTYAKIWWKYTDVDPVTNEKRGSAISYWDMLTNLGG